MSNRPPLHAVLGVFCEANARSDCPFAAAKLGTWRLGGAGTAHWERIGLGAHRTGSVAGGGAWSAATAGVTCVVPTEVNHYAQGVSLHQLHSFHHTARYTSSCTFNAFAGCSYAHLSGVLSSPASLCATRRASLSCNLVTRSRSPVSAANLSEGKARQSISLEFSYRGKRARVSHFPWTAAACGAMRDARPRRPRSRRRHVGGAAPHAKCCAPNTAV